MDRHEGRLELFTDIAEEGRLIAAATSGIRVIKNEEDPVISDLRQRLNTVRNGYVESIKLTPEEARWFGKAASNHMAEEISMLIEPWGAHSLATVHKQVLDFADERAVAA